MRNQLRVDANKKIETNRREIQYRNGRDPRRRDWNWIDPFSLMHRVASSIRNPEMKMKTKREREILL
jgi:hypothetical protein